MLSCTTHSTKIQKLIFLRKSCIEYMRACFCGKGQLFLRKESCVKISENYKSEKIRENKRINEYEKEYT